MGTSSGNTETTQHDTRSADLARLRTRLWRRSSLLTCGVLIVALLATWVANAAIANNINKGMLVGQFIDPVRPDVLLNARDVAKESVAAALNERFRQNALAGMDGAQNETLWLPHGYGKDNALDYGTSVGAPFRVAVFEDGSMTFLDSPNVFLLEDQLIQMVEQAMEKREEGGPNLREQTVSVDGVSAEEQTWMWTTQVAVVNLEYDSSNPESSQLSMYASGDLSEYAEGGMFAARIFAFADITRSVTQLKQLAIVLGIAGIAGCILLVIVCRKIIDRALKPVGEAWDRQREFLIKASHELKTPMASLSSNLDALVVNGDETVASQVQWTDNMREDIDQLADRTCRLLDLVTQPDEVEEGPEEK